MLIIIDCCLSRLFPLCLLDSSAIISVVKIFWNFPALNLWYARKKVGLINYYDMYYIIPNLGIQWITLLTVHVQYASILKL